MNTTLRGETAPSVDELIDALADYYRCPPAVALAWLTTAFRNFDPKAAAEALAARGPT